MRGQVRGKIVERGVDECVIADVCGAAETRKPRRTLAIIGKQAVHVSTDHPAVR